MRRLVVALIAIAGCYSPDPKDCAFRCTMETGCPEHLACVDGACRVAGATGTCTIDPSDGGVDATLDRPKFPTVDLVDLGQDRFTEPTVAANERQMWVTSQGAIYLATRSTAGGVWSEPMREEELVVPGAFSGSPAVSSDGLQLLFASDRSGAQGVDIYTTVRPNTSSDWGPAVAVTQLSTAENESPGGARFEGMLAREMVMTRSAGSDPGELVEATFSGAGWQVGRTVDELGSEMEEGHATLTADGLEVVFWSHRTGKADLFYANRASTTARWNPPQAMTELNSPDRDTLYPWISPDGRVLYFAQQMIVDPTKRRIFRAEREQ